MSVFGKPAGPGSLVLEGRASEIIVIGPAALPNNHVKVFCLRLVVES